MRFEHLFNVAHKLLPNETLYLDFADVRILPPINFRIGMTSDSFCDVFVTLPEEL